MTVARGVVLKCRVQTIRAYSLSVSALLLLACGNDDNGLTGGPGQLTGPCIQGQCLPGLQCFVDECLPGAGGNSNGNSNSNSNSNSDGEPDPTGTTGDTDGVTQGSMTQPTTVATTPGTATDDPSTTSTTSTTTVEPTTWRPDNTETFVSSDSDDSRGFILPETDSDSGEPPTCGGDVCDSDETCTLLGSDPFCLPHCDPLANPSCGPDYVCSPEADVFVCAPDASGNTGQLGQGCAYSNGCDPGLACIGGQFVPNCNGQACCSPFCDLDLADPCVQYGMACVAWYEQGQAPAGWEDVGVCAVL